MRRRVIRLCPDGVTYRKTAGIVPTVFPLLPLRISGDLCRKYLSNLKNSSVPPIWENSVASPIVHFSINGLTQKVGIGLPPTFTENVIVPHCCHWNFLRGWLSCPQSVFSKTRRGVGSLPGRGYYKPCQIASISITNQHSRGSFLFPLNGTISPKPLQGEINWPTAVFVTIM